jgi:uncharacterized membrane protein YfcA
VYGGYFGAAQGVILLALLGIFLTDHLQRLNATKNVLALVVNAMSAVVFIIAFTHIAWEAAGLIAAGSVVGGQVGGVARPPRAPIVLIAAAGGDHQGGGDRRRRPAGLMGLVGTLVRPCAWAS